MGLGHCVAKRPHKNVIWYILLIYIVYIYYTYTTYTNIYIYILYTIYCILYTIYYILYTIHNKPFREVHFGFQSVKISSVNGKSYAQI